LLSPRSTTAAAVAGDCSVWCRVGIGCGTAFVFSEVAERFAFFFFAAIAAPLDSLTGLPPKASGLGSNTQYIRPARHRAACRGFPHNYCRPSPDCAEPATAVPYGQGKEAYGQP